MPGPLFSWQKLDGGGRLRASFQESGGELGERGRHIPHVDFSAKEDLKQRRKDQFAERDLGGDIGL